MTTAMPADRGRAQDTHDAMARAGFDRGRYAVLADRPIRLHGDWRLQLLGSAARLARAGALVTGYRSVPTGTALGYQAAPAPGGGHGGGRADPGRDHC
jgi:hypothetical protein